MKYKFRTADGENRTFDIEGKTIRFHHGIFRTTSKSLAGLVKKIPTYYPILDAKNNVVNPKKTEVSNEKDIDPGD